MSLEEPILNIFNREKKLTTSTSEIKTKKIQALARAILKNIFKKISKMQNFDFSIFTKISIYIQVVLPTSKYKK